MEPVVCEVDGSRAAEQALEAAISFCRRRGASLELVGVVRESLFEAPQPAIGERIRRFREVEYALVQGLRLARAGGVEARALVRCGQPRRELLGEAKVAAGREAVVGRSPGWRSSLLARRPRLEMEEPVLGPGERGSPELLADRRRGGSARQPGSS